LEPVRSTNGWSDAGPAEQELDFGEVKGQQHVKRAVEVAAAGGHNILRLEAGGARLRLRVGTIKRLSSRLWLPFASRRVLQGTFTRHRSLNWKKTR
jgi:hypothetical protein